MNPKVSKEASELICSQLIAIAIATLSMSNVQANDCFPIHNNIISTNIHPVEDLLHQSDLSISKEESKDDIQFSQIQNNNELHNNNMIYDSNKDKMFNIVKKIKKQQNNYKQQKLGELSIIKDKRNNNEYEKYLFNFNDNNLMPKDKIINITKEINNIARDIILDKDNNSICMDNNDNIAYKHKTEEQRVTVLSDAMMHYYNVHDNYLFKSDNTYKNQNTYIPFSILQIMYNAIGKYDKNIAYKVINSVYNMNKDEVYNQSKTISQDEKFDYELKKKQHSFLGSYYFNNIPNKKELDEMQGKTLTDYWKHVNHCDIIFPSINIYYTDNYLQEAYKHWDNNIVFKLNNIIEQNINDNPIEHILNYYSIMANRSPNIYLSNDVIDFIYKKLDINDTIYFIDKFIKIKQNNLTEDDIPNENNNFQNIFNEYPNGNLKDYKINVYDKKIVLL
ncbi:MAG: hypothetical protein IJ848_03840 [Alphaproteobacteria bacterium]|nr:hypothetical protein [Alphaproteobacteria bacterium]